MKKRWFLFPLLLLALVSQVVAQSDVAEMFKTKCGICHTIGGGKLVGPDLANVQDRRTEDWLVEYIRSSQTMIKNGDPDAIALFEEYNKVIMPDPMISDREIKSIINHIAENSGSGVGTAAQVPSIIKDATPEDLDNGKALFEGNTRLANGGPSCISCHQTMNSVYESDNKYSTKDLMASFSSLGETGVQAILSNPPFPVMAKAYESHKLEEGEIHDLLVYLKNYDDKEKDVNLSSMVSNFLLWGLGGGILLIALYSAFWMNRKSYTVNKDLFDRQMKSYN